VPTISSTVIRKAPCEGSENLATNSQYRACDASVSSAPFHAASSFAARPDVSDRQPAGAYPRTRTKRDGHSVA
jgi:hypothetical protein